MNEQNVAKRSAASEPCAAERSETTQRVVAALGESENKATQRVAAEANGEHIL
jgi:hypothetical protein